MKYYDKPFIKELFYKALPLAIGSILAALIMLVDNFMIGIMQPNGGAELAAASLANKYVSIVKIFVVASISMFSFLVYQYKGAKKEQEIKQTIKLIVIFVLIVDAIGILVGWIITDHILHFFQGINYGNASTSSGIAQEYLRASIFTIIPSSLIMVSLVGLNAYGKQKILIPMMIIAIGINALFNYVFYKVAGLGLEGVAYSTILADFIGITIIIWWIFKNKLNKILLFNPLLIWKLNTQILRKGFSRFAMALQAILWSSISIGITIIYSNWYGDVANERLAIVMPIVAIFYTALDGVASTKGYFVGSRIGAGDKEGVLEIDKKINMYTFVVSVVEGILLVALAFVLPLAWQSVSSTVHFEASLMLVIVGVTYPLAALSKNLLGSFKVAGMGKTIILSNGLFALFFEFMIPFILFMIWKYTGLVHLEFWQLYFIARSVKLLKLPPTLYFWKQKKWLEKSI